jgi:hypothetical protein
MKTSARFLLALPLLLSVSNSALAAATDDEAARLTEVFQSYLGTTEGVVAVEPDGDDYSVTIDSAPLFAKAASEGTTISLTPIELTLTDNGEGKWNVSQEGPLEFKVESKNAISANFKIETYSWEGVFDEKLGNFESASGEMKNATVLESVVDPTQGKIDVSATVNNVKVEQSGTANANGGSDMVAKYELDGFSETISTAGDAASGKPPLNIVVTAATGVYDTTAKGYKVKSILDLVAFFVAHQSKELIIKDQAGLKAIMSEGLPLFENINGTGTFKTVSISTPVGPVGADTMAFGADINGIVKDGKFRESIAITGLTVPPAVVPPWATQLVPKDVTFDIQGSGFDLATPAAAVMAALDFSKEPPLPAGFENTLLPSLLPKGTVDVVLNPTSVSNDIYNISAEATLAAGPMNPIPSGKGTVKAKGLDELMKIIQAAPPEAGMQSGASIIIAAKGMGKAEADGSFTWNIESAGDGKVLVNGIDVTQMK